MNFIALLIAIAALVIALLAYKRTGGTSKDFSKELEKPIDTIREKTAETLSKVGKSIRKENE